MINCAITWAYHTTPDTTPPHRLQWFGSDQVMITLPVGVGVAFTQTSLDQTGGTRSKAVRVGATPLGQKNPIITWI